MPRRPLLLLAALALLVPAGTQAEVLLVHIHDFKEPNTTRLEVPTTGMWFEIDSFSLGVENSVNIGSISAGAGAGKATFTPIVLTKAFDRVSARLAQHAFILQAGAMKVQAHERTPEGVNEAAGDAFTWSRVTNEAELNVR